MSTLTAVASFDGDGVNPAGGALATDADGDLFGATINGGPDRDGTLFEIAVTPSGYASTPTTLVNFDGSDGAEPSGGLIADADGDLFGTTISGGADGEGTLFELAKMPGGYASTPVTLLSFNVSDGASPYGSLIADANGDLFGTTYDGGPTSNGAPDGYGTVFELAKTASGYASTPITLALFDIGNGSNPGGGLTMDASGDLFGTAEFGGSAAGYGTVFEISKTATGYASTVTTLAIFDYTDGGYPSGGLIMDAKGDLFGTAPDGGNGYGVVFEITKTAAGYASTPTTVANFDYRDGEGPNGQLIMDADGDLFGTAGSGGASFGTVFEIAKTADGYASTPTTVAIFDSTDGAQPGDLIADAGGNLFGTTVYGGAGNAGAVFEVTDSGYVACFCPETRILTSRGEVAVTDLREGDMVLTADGAAEPIRWIGRRSYAGRFIAGNHLMLPVTIRAGALADGVPHTDLHVSPGHGMVVDGQLVPAWRLINGATITQADAVDAVHYLHVELHRHAVLLANGAPTESYLDEAGFRGQFHNAADFHARFPDAAPMAPMQARLEDGLALWKLQRRLMVRAGITPRVTPTGALLGFVDQATPQRVCGWAQDGDDPETPVMLEIQVGRRPVLCILANGYRADLRQAGIGSGCHAFDLVPPAGLRGTVTVRRIGDKAVLRMTDDAKATLRTTAVKIKGFGPVRHRQPIRLMSNKP